ncbi:MAG TPA: helix-turn-helix transcriptional regulator [Terriglobia bacterium]|nr:helix-turn-helix transcriptional regulator [Terriglobia bacterium]
MKLNLKARRRKLGLTQRDVASHLGVTQAYVSMLEAGERAVPASLAPKLMKLYKLQPTVLPLGKVQKHADPDSLARRLASLGYPGFAHLRSRTRKVNPATFLLTALSHSNLEARVVEGLPWVVSHYPDMDFAWLVQQARMNNLQNRLGFCITLARVASGNNSLLNAEQNLSDSKLAREDYFGRQPNEVERRWLQEHSSDQARQWNLLSDLRPENLRYVS